MIVQIYNNNKFRSPYLTGDKSQLFPQLFLQKFHMPAFPPNQCNIEANDWKNNRKSLIASIQLIALK